MKYDPDPLQDAITAAAMEQVGERTLRVRRSTDEERARWNRDHKEPLPEWVAVFTDTDDFLTFAGVYAYGGATEAEALEDARRIASKWDWDVEDRRAENGHPGASAE